MSQKPTECASITGTRSSIQPLAPRSRSFSANARLARQLWGDIPSASLQVLRELTERHDLSVGAGEILYLGNRWYVSHAGLLWIATHNKCQGIQVQPVRKFCDSSRRIWAFRATVYRSKTSRGFVGYGDADPSNVSPLVHGAEMRMAETRAVNRALRKAYGVGICSIEEIGSACARADAAHGPKKLPAQPVNGNGWNGGPKVRDRLCQLIRQHQLDATLVKAYAVDFCGTKSLREATREQVENFVKHLAEWAESDRNALLCQLNSYLSSKEGVA
jgi:hypothetical protein